ncbi:MAG: Ig-like domain-containing protein [Salinivirgaceae bacterium]|nr:Ig-like domain-containing protein [Salinivirgaceae bacterium]
MKKLFLAVITCLTVFASCKEDDETVISIEIEDGETVQMIYGEQKQLHASISPKGVASVKSWSSSAPNIVSMSATGVATANSEGEATITLTATNNATATCHIVVSAIAITEIKVDGEYEVLVGGSLQLAPKVSPSTASYKDNLVYTSTNEAVAKVDKNGKVETIAVGECQINIASPDGKVTTSCKLLVLPNEVASIALNKSELTIELGETFKFEVVIEPKIATDKTVTWASSDESIAAIGDDGTLTGVGIGECTITANSSNEKVKAECKVNVTPASVKGLELSKTNAKILIGSTDAITANVIPANAANKNVTWTSSDETIATVDNGIVTGIAEGTATITATTEDGGFNKTCEVTVGGINIFMSAQNGNVVTTFTNFGVYTYVSCEITNNSNVDVFVKSANVSGNIFDISETLSSGGKLSNTFHNGGSIIVWTIVYDGNEYDVVSEFNSMYGMEDLLGY